MLISSDSHVVEPGDLWTTRLPAEFRDRCLRAVQDPDNHHWYMTGPDLPRGVDLTLSVTAGITPAAPLVGAVTTRPNAAFSSFTASAKQLTHASVCWNAGRLARTASSQESTSSQDALPSMPLLSPAARRVTPSPPGSTPRV